MKVWERRLAVLMCACTTLTLAGCGGGRGGSSAVTPPPVTPPAAVGSVAITPSPVSATIGTTQQFSAAVTGASVTDNTVTWSVAAPLGSTFSPGTITKAGLYTTPYPAPATVTVKAISNQDAAVSGSVAVTLNAPSIANGPALTVDAGNQTHPINPYIYGMNAFTLDPAAAKASGVTINRWGGDATSRYNYVLDVTNSAGDWYFENQVGLAGGSRSNSSFNTQVAADRQVGAKTLGTMPVLGWVAKDGIACGFPTATFPGQQIIAPDRACGNGVYPQNVNGCTDAKGCNIIGNDPSLTGQAVSSAWAGNWVTYLVTQFGTAANGGVAIYDLDNEPAWWDAVHRDVHPLPSTYDEVTDTGLAVAKAVKTADPTAEVGGPVVDFWWNYFYSKKDIESGWGSGPCFQPWQRPVDRIAHGGVPFIEYYLQKFKAYDDTNHVRLLNYVDLHTYFAANNLAFSTAGDTTAQKARLDSTRVFWDPTYTDPNLNQPNYSTDANYTPSCTVPLQAPQVIPMMHKWVADDYPGTKLAITEYNWGGQEHINGALAQADMLGIFGREGLDLATLWAPPDPVKQIPGLMAYEIFRNYDGKFAAFGDMALASTSVNQGQLSAYGALRTLDNTITVVVLNKTYGDLTSTLSLNHLAPTTITAQAYLYSSADTSKIVPQPAVTVAPSVAGSITSAVTMKFPAQSITLLVMPD